MGPQHEPGGAGPIGAEPARRREPDRGRRAQERAETMAAFASGEGSWVHAIEDAPTYHPTPAEFKEPLRFIHSIQAAASKFGICKIVPPVLPSTLATSVLSPAGKRKMSFGTRQQRLRAEPWDDFNPGRFMQSPQPSTLAEFEERANAFHRAKFGTAGVLPPRVVEAEYWRHKEGPDAGQAKDEVVEYGNDVVGTAFASPTSADPLASSKWNLQVLPMLEDSTLRLLDVDVPGVTSPMLYVGMLFASFAWHVEDQYLYSINYQHHGAAKTWYGVPASDADAFEGVVQRHVYKRAADAARAQGKSAAHIVAACQRALIGKTTMVNPKLLMDNGVRVCRAVQQPGEFIITFPRGYHAGFSNGFCLGEAANFALADWLPFGAAACRRYARLGHAPLLAQAAALCSEAEALAGHVGPIPGTKARVVPEFAALLRSTQEQIRQLQAAGAAVKTARHAEADCSHCREACYLAHAVLKGGRNACCLRCALAPERARGGGGVVLVDPELQRYAGLALELEARARGESTLPLVGLDDPLGDALGEAGPSGAAAGSAPPEDSDASAVDDEGRTVRSAVPPPRRADARRSGGGGRTRAGARDAQPARGAGALSVVPAATRRQRSPRPQPRKRPLPGPDSSSNDTVAAAGLPPLQGKAQPAPAQPVGPSGPPAVDPFELLAGQDELPGAQPPAKRQRRSPTKKQQQRRRQSAPAAARAATRAPAAAAAAPAQAAQPQAVEASLAPAVLQPRPGSEEPVQAQGGGQAAAAGADAPTEAEPPQQAAAEQRAGGRATPEPGGAQAPAVRCPPFLAATAGACRGSSEATGSPLQAGAGAQPDAAIGEAAAAPEAGKAAEGALPAAPAAPTDPAAALAAAARAASTEAEQAMQLVGSWVRGSLGLQPRQPAAARRPGRAAAAAAQRPEAAAAQPGSPAEARGGAAVEAQPPQPEAAAVQAGTPDEGRLAAAAGAATQPAEAGSQPVEAVAVAPRKGRGRKPARGQARRPRKAQPKQQTPRAAAERGEAAAAAPGGSTLAAGQRKRRQGPRARGPGVAKPGARQSLRQAALRSLEDGSGAAAAPERPAEQPAAAQEQLPPATLAPEGPAAGVQPQPAAAAGPSSAPAAAAAAQGGRGSWPRAQPRRTRQQAAAGAAVAAAAPAARERAAAQRSGRRRSSQPEAQPPAAQLQGGIGLSDTTAPSDGGGAGGDCQAGEAAAPQQRQQPAAGTRALSRLGETAAAAEAQQAQPELATAPAVQPGSPAAAQDEPAAESRPAESAEAAEATEAAAQPELAAAAQPESQVEAQAGGAAEAQPAEQAAAAEQQPEAAAGQPGSASEAQAAAAADAAAHAAPRPAEAARQAGAAAEAGSRPAAAAAMPRKGRGGSKPQGQPERAGPPAKRRRQAAADPGTASSESEGEGTDGGGDSEYCPPGSGDARGSAGEQRKRPAPTTRQHSRLSRAAAAEPAGEGSDTEALQLPARTAAPRRARDQPQAPEQAGQAS